MSDPRPLLTKERSARLAERAYIIPLTFGRARIVVDVPPPPGREPSLYESEFW